MSARLLRALGTMVALGVLMAAATAEAGPGGGARVAVLPFVGPGADKAEQRLYGALRQRQDDVRVVPPRQVRAALAEGSGDPATAGGRVALARALDAQALVTGRVSRRGKRWLVEVRVHEGATGEEVGGTRWGHTKVGPLLQRISRQSWARLGSAIGGARPAPEAPPAPAQRSDEGAPSTEPMPAGTAPEQAPVDGDAPEGERRPQALRLAAGMHLLSRQFSFNEDLFGTLAGYDLRAAPAVALEAEWYPGAHVTDGAWAHVGVRLRYVRMFGVRSEPSINVEDTQFDTHFDRIEAGLRGRVPLGRMELVLGGEFGQQRFGLRAPDEAQGRAMPDVRYRFLRFEAGVTCEPQPWFRLDLLAGYLHPFSFGDLGSDEWFPRVRGGGVDGRIVTVFITPPGVEVRLVGEMRRFFFDMRPEPGDARVAGGAVDEVWSAGLELGWRY